MKEYIKLGFGLTAGSVIALAVLKTVTRGYLKWAAKDDKLMEHFKVKDPEMYEKMKNYVSK